MPFSWGFLLQQGLAPQQQQYAQPPETGPEDNLPWWTIDVALAELIEEIHEAPIVLWLAPLLRGGAKGGRRWRRQRHRSNSQLLHGECSQKEILFCLCILGRRCSSAATYDKHEYGGRRLLRCTI